jgi:selenide,water dikinase
LNKISFTNQLVLIGGGHANIQVLKELCMKNYQGLHTILINKEYHATYSGMTPGFIFNKFSQQEIDIDLQRLCFNAGATFIKDEVVDLDLKNNQIKLLTYPSIYFDILSLNTGSISNNRSLKIDNLSNCINVKPISDLVNQLSKIDDAASQKTNSCISIIGGGIASYEISFSLKQRYLENVKINIIGDNQLSEKNINQSSKKKLRKIAKHIGINIIEDKVEQIKTDHLQLASHKKIKSNLNLLSTGADIPPWLEKTQLLKSKSGFIAVNKYLQSQNFEDVFVAGDIAEVSGCKRVKSGVMAVRQGQVLKKNLFLKLQNKNMIKFKAQQNWLYLIGTHNNKAILNYYFISIHSRWSWYLKVLIDQRFIKKFSFPNKKYMKKKLIGSIKNIETMHCQGCGSKASKNSLLNYLEKESKKQLLPDASVIEHSSTKIIQSIDHVKLFSSLNPFDFGVISYLHSKNDILAAGGLVKSLSISIGIPFSEKIVESFFLEYFMEGVKSQANKDNAIIASGHTFQTHEPGITLNMNGKFDLQSHKDMAQENDLIYLSKPLGTGYLLAAYYLNSPLVLSQNIQKLFNFLKLDNQLAYDAAKNNECNAMTDISGFGLASHLGDICEASNLSANINLNNEILINDKIAILDNFESTGFANNYESNSQNIYLKNSNYLEKVLYDPQTNGPMLMAINNNNKEKFEKDFYSLNQRKPLLIGSFEKRIDNLIIVE